MYIDSHAHIYLEEFSSDLDQVLESGHSRGVSKVYMPNIDMNSVESLHKVEENYPHCKAMMGLHPCYVKEDYKIQLDAIRNWTEKREYAAIGEIGIDLYWDKTFVDEQMIVFKEQIRLARELGLAIIIHSRDSLDITIEEVTKLQDGRLKGIFHCFNGSVDQGKKIIDLGFHLGIGGVVTFKNAGVDRTVKQLPLSNMVLETDSPYLSPSPYRGKRNEISNISIIAEKLAEVLDVSPKLVGEITTTNCKSVFKY